MDNSDPVITCPIQNRCQRRTEGKAGNVIETRGPGGGGARRARKGSSDRAYVGKTEEGGPAGAAAIYYSDTRARRFYDPPYFLP